MLLARKPGVRHQKHAAVPAEPRDLSGAAAFGYFDTRLMPNAFWLAHSAMNRRATHTRRRVEDAGVRTNASHLP